jgi:hypothetical protein
MKFFARKNRFRAARDKGGAYLLPTQRPDGSFGTGLYDYYKTLMAFQVCGFNHEANALCSWIRARAMTPEGDFGPRDHDNQQYNYTYANSWIVLGAHRLGQFDISQKAMEFLMGFWNPQSGGFYSSPTERDADTKQDVIYTGFCGLAALSTGRIDVARAVGRWMKTIMELQPDFPQKLYTVYSKANGLHTTIDTEQELRYVVLSNARRDQFFFQPGVAAGFLARLFQATGEREWLDLAKEYMRFVEGADDYLFRLVRAGKVGWAASVLYTLTGEPKYKEIAVRIGNNLIDCQARGGSWTAPQGNQPSDEVTAEMTIWLDEIDQAVGNERTNSFV